MWNGRRTIIFYHMNVAVPDKISKKHFCLTGKILLTRFIGVIHKEMLYFAHFQPLCLYKQTENKQWNLSFSFWWKITRGQKICLKSICFYCSTTHMQLFMFKWGGVNHLNYRPKKLIYSECQIVMEFNANNSFCLGNNICNVMQETSVSI